MVTQFSNNENKKDTPKEVKNLKKDEEKKNVYVEKKEEQKFVEIKKNIQPQIQNNIQPQIQNNNINKQISISSNQSSSNSNNPVTKKKETDLKDISDFMGKRKENSKKLSNPNAKELVNVKDNNKEKQIVKDDKSSNKQVNNEFINVNDSNQNKNCNNQPSGGFNSLKEFMKLKKEELKQQPAEDIVWLGAKADKEVIKKDDYQPRKLLKKITIVDEKKEKPVKENKDIIDINANIILPNKPKLNKDEEEFYNLNRYLYELAVKILN